MTRRQATGETITAETTVRKWGASCGVTIPAAVSKKLGVKVGTKLQMRTSGQSIVVTKVRPGRRPRRPLREILKQMTPQEPMKGWDETPPVGEEVI